MREYESQDVAELVVLVDEDICNLRSVRRTLGDLELRVLEFSSSAAALPVVLARRPDVIIAEHGLSGLGGVGLSVRARERWGDERPAFVAMTASPGDLGDEERSHYDVVLAKPIRTGELTDAVERAIAVAFAHRRPAQRLRVAGR